MEYIYTTLDKNKWILLLIIVLNILLYCLRIYKDTLKNSINEGFQMKGGKHIITPDQARDCPMYKKNLQSNNELLKGYLEKEAVISAQNAQVLIDLFQKKYDEFSCDEYFESIGETPTAAATTT